jgi:ParB-like chromosome segregation protein Spo0J
MQIETLAIDRLIPYARNSRTHSDAQVAQIAASIKEFGFTNPVLIDAEGGIIAGHGRVMGARQLGLAEVPCIRLGHLTDAQRRAYVIADNKLALNAGWDEKMLALEFKDLQAMDFDIELTGFGLGDIDELLAELDATPEGATDADETPAVQADAVSQPGDVWLLGKHRIMCGDSTSADHVKTLLGGGHAASHGY